jgi:hypothetical protein
LAKVPIASIETRKAEEMYIMDEILRFVTGTVVVEML